MTASDQSTRASVPLIRELRWLIRLRWLAGIAVIVSVIISGTLSGWNRHHSAAAVLGAVILSYNLPFWLTLRSPSQQMDRRLLVVLPWLQIVLDLLCLTLAMVWTGGLNSPLRGFFVLHMVLSSLLLRPPSSYLVAILAMVMVVAGLWLSDHWNQSKQQLPDLGAWALVLLLTVFLTGHITADLRRQDIAARDSLQQIRAILQTAADGIITIDVGGMIQSTNPAADRIFGYQAGELTGQDVKLLMPEPYRAEHDGYMDNYLRTHQARIIGIGREVRGRRRDGSEFPLDLAVSEVSLAGRTWFTGIVRDISDRKRAEQELVGLNQQLQRHQQALIQQEKVTAMGQMAAGIVHEISNPLANMDTVLQLVQRQPERFNGQTTQTLREQVARINRIVRQLTDFAHPNETAWEIRALNEVVDGALDMVRFDHRIRRVEVVRQFDPLAPRVRVMVHALQQVLVNMVLNALDAMAQTSGPCLTVRTRLQDQWAIIEIADNGHGIAQENLSRIFEPFFTTKPLGQGTGLGLSISSSLVHRHGGRCQVKSRLGEGTTFVIMLPAWHNGQDPDPSCSREASPISHS